VLKTSGADPTTWPSVYLLSLSPFTRTPNLLVLFSLSLSDSQEQCEECFFLRALAFFKTFYIVFKNSVTYGMTIELVSSFSRAFMMLRNFGRPVL